MATKQMTLWEAIDELVRQIPFSKLKVETVLATRLEEVRRNAYTTFFEGGPVTLAAAQRIDKVDLRLGSDAGDAGFLVLSIEGACLGLAQVRAHHGDLKVTGAPRGRSLEEATTHSVQLPWGKLSFGFKERNPECLASVVLSPRKDL